MMHGFGDHPEPLVETAKIIESVVLNQMRGIVYKACEVADMRQNQIVTAEDFLFLLRKDKIKLQRFVNYLSKYLLLSMIIANGNVTSGSFYYYY